MLSKTDIQKWQGDHDVVMKTTAFRALVKMGSAACAERDARIAELEAAAFRDSTALNYWKDKCALLEQQLAEARKDAERLDFLAANPKSVSRSFGYLGSPDCWTARPDSLAQAQDFADLRDAIDAAIKEQT